MSRRNREKSLPDELFSLLKLTPVWVGPALAGIVYTLLRWFVPLLLAPKAGNPDVAAGFRIMLPTLAWVFAGVVLVAWAMAEIYKLQNRRLLDSQEGAECIRKLSWQEFERLVCEAYRRQGYVAEVVGSTTGDGGVDIELSRNGELLLVQCKHWKAYKVGVAPTRELLGVVVSRRVKKGILVTSGVFTKEAEEFASLNVQLVLVDGTGLWAMIRDVQNPETHSPDDGKALTQQTVMHDRPQCPTCGEAMVLRTARKGDNAGNQFWGCAKFPACRGTRDHAAV